MWQRFSVDIIQCPRHQSQHFLKSNTRKASIIHRNAIHQPIFNPVTHPNLYEYIFSRAVYIPSANFLVKSIRSTCKKGCSLLCTNNESQRIYILRTRSFQRTSLRENTCTMQRNGKESKLRNMYMDGCMHKKSCWKNIYFNAEFHSCLKACHTRRYAVVYPHSLRVWLRLHCTEKVYILIQEWSWLCK